MLNRQLTRLSLIIALMILCTSITLNAADYKPYTITVQNSSGQPIPLAQLKTVNKIIYYTDSNGQVAFYEPGLMNQEVYFHTTHTDYYKSADFFGNEGQAFTTTENSSGSVTLTEDTSGSDCFFPLDNGSGSTATDVMHASNATISGATWLINGGQEGVTGDHALQFDGSNDYARLSRNIQDNFTISFFMKTTQTASSGTQWWQGKGLVDAEVGGVQNDFGISLVGSKVCFGIGNSDTSIFSTTSVNDGNWHFITATRDKDTGTIKLYVDLIEEASGTANTNSLTTPSNIDIGRLQTGINYFNGTLDDIGIFDRVITLEEMYALREKTYKPTSQSINPHVITIVDSDTGRGVPCVELTSDCGPTYITDSAGVVAVYEPFFMYRNTSFSVYSHGYDAPSGGGFSATLTPGGSTQISIDRNNIAERMYRITGGGIYHQSTLAGLSVPLTNPNLSGKVLGQDTVSMTEYNGEYHWLWGDTDRPAYPLGNFKTSGGTSQLPGSGGLDPEDGVDITYFVDSNGFSKSMYPRSDASLVWMNMMNTVDDSGTERLIASYTAMDGSATAFENGVAIFNDSTEEWNSLTIYQSSHNLQPTGYSYKHTDGYIYCCAPYPTIRYLATRSAISNPATYEGFSCLVTGTTMKGGSTQVERDSYGNLVWAWKTNTGVLDDDDWQTLVNNSIVSSSEKWNWLTEAGTSNHVLLAGGSVEYNTFREKWVIIGQQIWGSSFLGEIWYAEADAIEGPWTTAVKVVSHNNYTFYNTQLHPQFDDNAGYLYFEGTYTNTYTDATPTPRYNYNQMMYRVDLLDPAITDAFPMSRGSIYVERWDGITGTAISDLINDADYPDNPSAVTELTSFDQPLNIADYYGSRIRAYVHPPTDGYYTFWVAGDDNCELYLSSDESENNKSLIAYVPDWTSYQQWTKFTEQQSSSIYLEAGKKYFIESFQKEGGGGDSLSVAWQGPGFSRTVIDGQYLSPVRLDRGSITMQWWDNITGTAVTDLTNNANYPNNPTGTTQMIIFDEEVDIDDDFGTRCQGYVSPPTSGLYSFWIAGDDNCELWLSPDDDPAHKVLIADVPGWTWHLEWTKYSNQHSADIFLIAGQKYFIQTFHKEAGGGDNLTVGWDCPDFSRTIIDGRFLSP